MKKIELKGLDISCYRETLDNGLEVILFPYSNKKNYFMSYATRYGSETTRFIPIGKDKEIKVPDGIAHFLEHKMFEQEDGIDPFTYFSKSGTGSNASTSFDSTQYICYGNKNFIDNLKFLLRFVNEPYYTDENVEKEKGIIAEELKMYDDIPDFRLEMKLRENVYHNHPRRVDVGGSIPEVYKTTKEDLYTCYENFYSPNNMFLLIVGNFPKDETIKTIRESLEDIPNRGKPVITPIDEKTSIRKSYEEITGPITLPKIGVGLKVDTSSLKLSPIEKDLYLMMITTIMFGGSSLFREEARNKKILNSLYTEWESIPSIDVFYLMATSTKPKSLLEEIEKLFKDFKLDIDSFNRVKKVWISNEVRMIDDIDATVRNQYDDFLNYKEIIPNKIDIIRNLSFDTLIDIYNKIDFNNKAVVVMKCDKKVK